MLESTVERHLREEAKKRKGMALKFVSPGMNGVPDRIVLMPDGNGIRGTESTGEETETASAKEKEDA